MFILRRKKGSDAKAEEKRRECKRTSAGKKRVAVMMLKIGRRKWLYCGLKSV